MSSSKKAGLQRFAPPGEHATERIPAWDRKAGGRFHEAGHAGADHSAVNAAAGAARRTGKNRVISPG